MKATFPRNFLRVACASSALLALAVPGRASDWYVDAALGSDSNSGTSPAAAWRTITHAVATIAALPIDAQTIHVAPGVYNAALGEVFPLHPAPRTRIVGSAGSALTILEGPATSILAWSASPSGTVGADSGADGLTLRQSMTGVAVGAGPSGVNPSFSDLRIQDMTGPGVRVGASGGPMFSGNSASATGVRIEIVQCDVGVLVQVQADSLSSAGGGATLTDSAIRSCTNDGIRFSATGNASATVRLNRCRVLDNGRHGSWSSVNGEITTTRLFVDASVFAGNVGCGVISDGATHGEFGESRLSDCTVANNADCGVRALGGTLASVRNCVLAHNGDDLDVYPTHLGASFTDCANGDLLGYPNCIAADPQFLDAAARDYRLQFGSPCIDVGDPASAGAIDFVGHMRRHDGDLDAVSVPDMGALEFETLALVGVPHSGSVIALEITGPAGAPTVLYMSRNPLALTPYSTANGDLWLGRRAATFYASTHADPGPPNVVPIALTSSPSWIGRTVAFQARIDSAAAPAGSAFGNPVEFTIVP